MKTFRIFIFCLIGFVGKSYSQTAPKLRYPHPFEITSQATLIFEWNNHPLLNQTFQFQLATDSLFTNIVEDIQTNNSTQLVSNIGATSASYFWRVRVVNPESNWSESRKFFFFLPTSLNGLTVWLDPTIGVTLNGTKVQQIADQSGLSNDAVQNNPTQQPLYVDSDPLINNKPSIKYDGIDDFLEMADNNSLDYTSSISIHTLVRPRVAATNKTILAKWDYQTQGAWVFQSEFALADELMFAPCFTITDPGAQKYYSTNADLISNRPYSLGMVYDGSAVVKTKFYRNGSLLNSTIVGSIPQTLPNSSATLKIGKFGGILTRYYDGDIVEVLIYNSVLSDLNRNLVDGYLRFKYAPPVDLGNDTIIASNALCGNILIKAQSAFQSYIWSTGATSSSINVTAPGTYWVTVTDFLGNISSDTINVFPPYTMNNPENDQLCINTTETWSTNYPSDTFSFLWQDGSTNPSLEISSPGSYYVIVSDGSGCSISSDTIEISLDNYENTAFLGNDTSLCAGNLIALQVGAAETMSYLWPNGATTPNYAVDTTGNYFVESTNVNGCVARDTINVTITGVAPVAEYAALNTCLGDAVNFEDNSFASNGNPVDEWLWDFGDGNTSPEQNPQYAYSAPGVYAVELYVAQGGCGAFTNGTIEVYATPQAAFSTAQTCSEETTIFSDLSTTGDASLNAWLWNFGNPALGLNNVSSQQSPGIQYGAAGDFEVYLQVTDNNGCTDDTLLTVAIARSPSADFTALDHCAGNNITFNNISSIPAPDAITDYLWDFGDNTFSVMPVPNKTYNNIGFHTITLTVVASNGCADTYQGQVFTHGNPVPAISLSPACAGNLTYLTDVSTVSTGSVAESSWEIDLVDILTGSPAAYTFPTTGSHNIELVSTSDFGCVGDTMIVINVQPGVTVDFNAFPEVFIGGENVSFTNQSTGQSNILWDFGDGNTSEELNPNHLYDAIWIDSTLQVTLTVSNALGCSDTLNQSFTVARPYFDLAINNIFLTEDNGFYTIGVELKNVGTSVVDEADVILRLSNGTQLQDRYEEVIQSGETAIMVFGAMPSAFLSDQNETEEYICAEATPYSGLNLQDEDFSNNRLCKNLEGNAPVLIGPDPNPATQQFHFSVLLSAESTITVDLTDARGRVVKQFYTDATLSKGLYSLDVPLLDLQSGVYTLRLSSGDTYVTRRLLVTED